MTLKQAGDWRLEEDVETSKFQTSKAFVPLYQTYFTNTDHTSFYGTDENAGPCIVSVAKVTSVCKLYVIVIVIIDL